MVHPVVRLTRLGVARDASGSNHFVVTGCGRSGTSYAATVLTAAGIPCGHEELFHPRVRSLPDFGTRRGDASWLAAPFVSKLPDGTVVLHQVRDPVQVIGSFYGLRFLGSRGLYSFRRPSGPPRLLWHELKSRVLRARGEPVFMARDFQKFVARHEPTVLDGRDTLDRCVRYWIAWNERVESEATRAGLPYLRYRLEDFEARWLEILDLLAEESRELPAVPPTVNSRPRHDPLSREQLRSCPDFERLQSLAHRYGYPLD